MVRTRYTLSMFVVIVAWYLALVGMACAAPKNYDLLNYVPADGYSLAAAVQPAEVFAAPVTNTILGEEWPRRLRARLEGFETLTGIDARKDLDAVVLAGNPPRLGGERGEGVAIVRGRWDKERILQAVGKAPEYAEKTVGGKTCYTFFAPRENEDRALAFLSDTVAVLGSPKAVEGVLEHDGKSKGSLGVEEAMHSLYAKIPSDASFWLTARRPQSTPAGGRSRPLAEHVAGVAAWGTLGDRVALEGWVTADSADSAKNMGQALEGLLALARLRFSATEAAESPAAKALQPIIDKVQWTVDQDQLGVKVELTAKDVKALKAVKEQAHTKREAAKGRRGQEDRHEWIRATRNAAPTESE